MPVESKRCTVCGYLKQASEFYTSRKYASGLRSSCKECERAAVLATDPEVRKGYSAAYRERHPDRVARYENHHRFARIGMTKQEYDELLSSQDGGCAGCGKAPINRLFSPNRALDGTVGLNCVMCTVILSRAPRSTYLVERINQLYAERKDAS